MGVQPIVKLMRPVPLVIWSVPTVVLGFLLQSHPAHGRWIALALAVVGALLLQGLVTHGLNDMFDWDSGTDQETTGIISGGSRVLVEGLMTRRQMWRVVWVAVGFYIATAFGLFLLRGPLVWLWAGLGIWGAVSYSVPPLRLSYRPYLGEWLALMPAMVSGVMLGGMASNSTLSASLIWGALIYGVFCVASVMQHHLSDMDADWAATPRKRTTPAYWFHGLKRRPATLILLYEILAWVLAAVAMLLVWRGFLWTLVMLLAAVWITATTMVPATPRRLTARDLAIKILSLMNVIGLLVLAQIH